MKIKIISIIKSEFGNLKSTEVIWKYKKRQQVNFIVGDEHFTEEEIINYLESIKEKL
jgi:ribosomal protein L1